MKHIAVCCFILAACFFATRTGAQTGGSQKQDSARPQYDGQNLVRPQNYRDWIFLSSGLGMNYAAGSGEMFTNVFVPEWSYRRFLATGKWPDKSIFVVEERRSENKGSINKTGHFQADFVGMGVEVKDESRFPDKWAYFNFSADTKTAPARPKAACWQCHNDNAAVEHTFVQFYPTLKEVAMKFGTYREPADRETPVR
jgi:hypothetical protein